MISASPRRRRRPAVACVECRRRKIRCDRKVPCDPCSHSNAACTYSANYASNGISHGSYLSNSTARSSYRVIGHESQPNTANLPSFAELDTTVCQRPIFSNWGSCGESRPDNRLGLESDAGVFAIHSPLITPEKVREDPQNLVQMSSGSACAYLDGFAKPSQTPGDDHKRNPLKTRFHGQSHWLHTFEQFHKIIALGKKTKSDQNSELGSLLNQCKNLARFIKATRPISQLSPPDIREYIPPKEISHQLVQLYLRTFEPIFRVLHIPSFQQEYIQYWNNPQEAHCSFIVKLLLVMAIGTCFYQDPSSSEPSMHFLSCRWISIAQLWLNTPLEKPHLNVTGLQIHCLLLLARQTSAIGGDLIWISAGSLLRAAMNMGLHRDPVHFPGMSIFQSEMRRRLWATILEISLQSSLDSGMPPLISYSDFDCKPPSNIDDAQIDEATESPPTPRSANSFTQSSFQIALIRSTRIRLEVAQLLNNLNSNSSYEETLRISSELTNECRTNSLLLQSFRSAPTDQTRPTAFQMKFLDFLTRRFLLSLHGPFAVKAETNPTYYFSRRICLESSLLLLSLPPCLQSPTTAMQDNDYGRLRLLAGGTFKRVIWLATATLCLELVNELLEDPSPFLASSLNSLSRKELYQAIRDSVDLTGRRIKAGETDIKGYVFFSCALGQIDALQAGTCPEQGVLVAAKKSLDFCYNVLNSKVKANPDQQAIIVASELEHAKARVDIDEQAWNLFVQDSDPSFDTPDVSRNEWWQEGNNWA